MFRVTFSQGVSTAIQSHGENRYAMRRPYRLETGVPCIDHHSCDSKAIDDVALALTADNSQRTVVDCNATPRLQAPGRHTLLAMHLCSLDHFRHASNETS
jgi:hypothetical protein